MLYNNHNNIFIALNPKTIATSEPYSEKLYTSKRLYKKEEFQRNIQCVLDKHEQ